MLPLNEFSVDCILSYSVWCVELIHMLRAFMPEQERFDHDVYTVD